MFDCEHDIVGSRDLLLGGAFFLYCTVLYCGEDSSEGGSRVLQVKRWYGPIADHRPCEWEPAPRRCRLHGSPQILPSTNELGSRILMMQLRHILLPDEVV